MAPFYFDYRLPALFCTLGLTGRKSNRYSMNIVSRAAFLAALLLTPNWYGLFADPSAAARRPQPPKPTVYVSDFIIDVLPAESGAQKPEDDPRRLASHLVELMSTRLVAALQKAGYTAVRMHAGDARPDSGVQIRGLFAEVDDENHWRRAVIRSASDTGKIEALVAVANLAKPDQALYEIANLPGNEDKPGAVITLSPYVPLTKFDLSKDADENVFKGIAPRVVTDLTDLLDRNPAAIPQ
jgi:Domain of unknown function (DUF4410)